MSEQCYCGHVLDEHEEGGPCTIEGCLCVYYDEASDE